MHIGIDTRMYGPQHGGIGRYIEQLITHMLKNDRTNTYTLFVHPNNKPNIDSNRITLVDTPIPWYSIKEQILLPRILKKHPVDIMHFPHWNVPLFFNQPYIVTIHDLILIHHPDRRASTLNPLLYKLKYKAFKKILAHAASSAQHILTVSEFSKKDIHKTLHASQEKITTTHLGVDHIHATTQPSPHNKPFMLAVGVQYPHKNLEFLCNVFSQLTDSPAAQYDLIIAGPRGPFSSQLEEQSLNINKTRTQPNQGQIICKFNQTDEILHALYKHAEIFLFPSLFEGFGLPPLEAMKASTPVIASNTSCIPEIIGGAGILIDPTDTQAWTTAIKKLSSSKTDRYTLTSRGHEQLKKFSWDACALSTLNAYKNL